MVFNEMLTERLSKQRNCSYFLYVVSILMFSVLFIGSRIVIFMCILMFLSSFFPSGVYVVH